MICFQDLALTAHTSGHEIMVSVLSYMESDHEIVVIELLVGSSTVRFAS